MLDERKYLDKYYRPLEGATIRRVSVYRENGEVWTTFSATLDGGGIVFLDLVSDEEGNGPGYLLGLPRVGCPPHPLHKGEQQCES